MTVYVVIQAKAETEHGLAMDIQGVFDDEAKARAACRDRMYGYGPVELNETMPHETVRWPGFTYPLDAGGM